MYILYICIDYNSNVKKKKLNISVEWPIKSVIFERY